MFLCVAGPWAARSQNAFPSKPTSHQVGGCNLRSCRVRSFQKSFLWFLFSNPLDSLRCTYSANYHPTKDPEEEGKGKKKPKGDFFFFFFMAQFCRGRKETKHEKENKRPGVFKTRRFRHLRGSPLGTD
jgi:hypothetical protein